MTDLNLELELAAAAARARRASAPQQEQPQEPQERGFGQMIYDNLVGDPNDGVQSYGESLGTWINRAGESATLGLAGDEASAAMYSTLRGTDYDAELQRLRQNEENMSGLGRLSADLVGAAVPALLGVGAVGTAARGLGGRFAAGLGFGAASGAGYGFMEGEGGFGDRAQSAALGGALGGVIGGAAPVAAEAGRSLWRMGSNAIRARGIGRDVAAQLGVTPETARVVTALIGSDDPAAMRAALSRAGPDAMLADASPQLSGALDYTLQTPVPGVQAARDRISTRAGAAYDDLVDALRGGRQGPQQSPASLMDSIRTGSAGARRTAYDAAYSIPIDYSSEAGARLLDRVSPRLPPEAITYANRLMRLRGEESAQIMASIADDGAVTFTRPPDVRQWDYIRQALGQLAESGDGAGALGGQTRMGAAYEGLSREIRDNVASLVPEYQTALDTAADAIGQRNAVRFGTELLSPRLTTDEVIEQIAGSTTAERAAMRSGIIGQIEELAGNVRAVASDQNIDARQALDAYRRLSSPNAQRRMEALFGDEWPAIRGQLERAGAALGLRANVATNSRTAGRAAVGQYIDDATVPGDLRRGRILGAAQNVAGELMGSGPEAISSMQEQVRSQIADLLTQQGGTASSAIDAVARALAARPTNFNAGSNLALALGLAGYGSIPAVSQVASALSAR
ncbi:hypothetical protein [Pararhodobacter sp. CCB-MM2]|uniref:hypothetical protein n=1 Tax=Pararhodobacter sp. CCB-MM2 TaxID=1786003 RepID=UPI00082D89A5|nr:hypothetical protein [Pararhodobacter sp. CCB-MM2]